MCIRFYLVMTCWTIIIFSKTSKGGIPYRLAVFVWCCACCRLLFVFVNITSTFDIHLKLASWYKQYQLLKLSIVLKCISIIIFSFQFLWYCIPFRCTLYIIYFSCRGCGGRDHMIVGFTTTCAISANITTKVVSSNPAHGKMYSIQYNVITFVSDLQQVRGFLWILRFPPPIKLTAMI